MRNGARTQGSPCVTLDDKNRCCREIGSLPFTVRVLGEVGGDGDTHGSVLPETKRFVQPQALVFMKVELVLHVGATTEGLRCPWGRSRV